MKRMFLIITAVLVLAGCRDAAVEELKKTPVDPAEPEVTFGALFDTVFTDAQWVSSVDGNGTESVTVTGLFDWKEGAGAQESSFRMEKNAEGKWAPVAVTAGGKEMTSSFTVGISFLVVCSYYQKVRTRESAGTETLSLSPETGSENIR